MTFVKERKIKGADYVYLEKSIRIYDKVQKIGSYVGRRSELSKKEIEKEKKKFLLSVDQKIVNLMLKEAKKKFQLTYPLSLEEIKKIEEMRLRYKKIKQDLNKKNWTDIKKRFIANFVFESNALEGNSLTLKNFSDIIFEKRVNHPAELREIYDAENSYKVFSRLFNTRKEISEEFIIDIHKKIMKGIDNRTGYKQIPNFLLGKQLKLTAPEKVKAEMAELIKWYNKNEQNIYPLELAFRFHHKFECIHPFADGNGRVGRMLLNYILIKKNYFPIIIRNSQRTKYIKALEVADKGQNIPLIRFALERAKTTYKKFFEVYYNYI